MKKYIGQTLRRFLPFFIITGALLLGMALMYVGNETSVYISYVNYFEGEPYSYITTRPYSGLLYLLIPVFIITTLAPLIANYYRYSLKSVDLFYQTGKGNKTIRYVDNLTILIMIIAIFSVAFIGTCLFMMLQQIPFIGKVEQQDNMIVQYVFFNYYWYPLAYLGSVIFIIVDYAISYFFVTRSNNFVNSLIILIAGHLVLGLTLMMPDWIYESFVAGIYNVARLNTSFMGGLKSFSPISLMILINNVFNPLIIGDTPYTFIPVGKSQIVCLILFIIGLVGCLAVAALGIVKFITEKESSGEFAGKPVGRDVFQEIIFHAGFVICAIGSALISNVGILGVFGIVYAFSSFIMTTAVYFALTGLLRRRFRWNWKEWVLFGGLSSINLFISIALAIVNLGVFISSQIG